MSLKNLYKAFFVAVILFAATTPVFASRPFECYKTGTFAFDLSVGSNLDLSSLSQEQKTVFEERPRASFQITMRPSYYFSHHWGAYVDFTFTFFRFNNLERMLDMLMPILGSLKPTLSLGGTYRYEHRSWQIQPRLGLGIVGYGDRNTKFNRDGKETIQKRTGSMWSIDTGVSAAFRTSKVCSIFLDLSAVQPFTPAKYTKTTTFDGVTTHYQAESYSWGRSMSISLGIRLQTSGK